MGAVNQPVKDALGQNRVGEEVIPVLGGAVGGHYYGTPTAALRNTLVEILCLLGIEGVRQETDGLDEENLIAKAAGLVAQGQGNVTFSHSHGPADDH
jgi:hypothetical protein